MASYRLKSTKDGKQFYEIRVRLQRDKPELTSRWYIPDGWSKKAIDREIVKVAAEFERKCESGEIISRAEQKKIAEADAKAATQIKTFRQYGEQVFMPAKRITNTENTRRYYQWCLDYHLYAEFGELKMPEITAAQISAFFLRLQESSLSHKSINGIYVCMNQLMKMAYCDDTIPVNPMGKVQRPRQRKDEKKSDVPEAFTAQEVSFIRSRLENEPLKWRAMVNLLLETGMRRGEVCGLRWECIDWKTNTARVELNVCYTKDMGVYLAKPKTGQVRQVYFSPITASLLRQLREEQASSCISPYVFTQEGLADPMHPDSPDRFLQKFGKKNGIAIHPHKLRHTAATLMVTANQDIASVSRILGHAQISTTLNMYVHPDEDSKRKAAEALFRAIG